MTDRFKDDGRTLTSFGGNFLVHCPRCNNCAKVFNLNKGNFFSPQRMVCTHCGYAKDREEKSFGTGRGSDWFFGLPLWLEIACCSNTLWAYNAEHLNYLEEFVRAKIRETDIAARKQASSQANVNRTLASKLPRWIKSAKNRDEILHCIEKLRKTLE